MYSYEFRRSGVLYKMNFYICLIKEKKIVREFFFMFLFKYFISLLYKM